MAKDLLQTIAILIFSFSHRVGNGQTDEWLCRSHRMGGEPTIVGFSVVFFSFPTFKNGADASVSSVGLWCVGFI
jgi:hypothetical protein